MATYRFIAKASGANTTYTFSSLPQTFDTLVLWWKLKTNLNANYDTARIRLNSDASNHSFFICRMRYANLDYVRTDTLSGTSGWDFPVQGNNGSYSSGMMYIGNYKGTTSQKVANNSGSTDYVGDSTTAYGHAFYGGALYNSNNAVTSISITIPSAASFASSSNVWLYGIKNT